MDTRQLPSDCPVSLKASMRVSCSPSRLLVSVRSTCFAPAPARQCVSMLLRFALSYETSAASWSKHISQRYSFGFPSFQVHILSPRISLINIPLSSALVAFLLLCYVHATINTRAAEMINDILSGVFLNRSSGWVF